MRSALSLLVPALLLAGCAGDKITDPVPTAPITQPTAGSAIQSSATAMITVLMSGLDAPRGLAWGPEDGLYVAEAGTRTINGLCASVAGGCSWLTPAATRWCRCSRTVA